MLFPHMPMALHVFEDRYREMMRECSRTGTTFGVVAIREGMEVGGPAEPYSVGTLALQRQVEELPDGRFNLLVLGASRFRIDSMSTQRPYIVAAIHYLEDVPAAADDAALAKRVREAFRAYATSLRAGAESEPRDSAAELDLPDEPELLSYIVAASLNVETARRQALLELDSTTARLQGCLAMLRREAVLLEQMLGRPRPPAALASLN
ncbi:MAG: peptidase S16 [Chloroflexi bacterium]|nr:MAG: peptidase S16 [Chloroflexota bacterium]